MTVSWPVGVPLIAESDGYTEKVERAVASFAPPQAGQEIERTRTKLPTSLITFTQFLRSSEYDALRSFYRATLADGVLPFTRAHPRTGVTCTFKFTAEPAITGIYGLNFQVPIKLRLLPS